MSSAVLRVRRTDDSSFIVLRVQQARVARLDLELYATDGVFPFGGTIEHNTVDSLQARAFNGSSQEWKAIISAVLLSQWSAGNTDLLENVETTATVGDSLILTIRRDVEGISQRLGEITLQKQEDLEISLFDWTAEAAAKATAEQQQARLLEARVHEQEQALAQVRSQLDKSTGERERQTEDLLKRFTALLNTKKLKIRDQQRLLARHSIDAVNTDMSDDAPLPDRKGGKAPKRKAKEVLDDSDAQHDSEETDAEEERQRTETPDLESDAEQRVDDREGGQQEHPTALKDHETMSKKGELPPKRELPFTSGRKGKSVVGPAATASKSSQGDAGSDTEDEL